MRLRPRARTAAPAFGTGGQSGSFRPLGLCTACNVEDFADERLQRVIRDVHRSDIAPVGREDRKMWEVATAVRALDELGALRPDAELLGVGAGHEATVYHLTNHVKRVFATDLYLSPGEQWERTAGTDMLGDPGRYWAGPWNERRLVVQHMDALDLRYEDATFDGIFSSSSIEHFGSLENVRRSLSEMCRVLKPGGICSVSTELRLAGEGLGLPDILMFTPEQLGELLEGLPWELVEPLDASLSERTRSVVVDFAEAAGDVRAGRPRWSTYPHVLLSLEGYTWTSVHVALRRV